MNNLLSLLLMLSMVSNNLLELTEKGLTQSSGNARENHKHEQKHIGDMLKFTKNHQVCRYGN